MHQFIMGGRGELGRGGRLNLCVETIHSFKGINVTVLERMHHFIVDLLLFNKQHSVKIVARFCSCKRSILIWEVCR